jgi:peptidoglycan/LPS O-acetylase OafA/YrhL
MTVAFRTLAATASAYLLYRSLLPSSHPSSLPALSSFLSFPPFKFLASISFCSYLIHFRLLMEMILNPKFRMITGLSLPSVVITAEASLDTLVNQWLLFIVLNGALATVLSILLSTVFYFGFEKPMTSFVKQMIDGSKPPQTVAKGTKETKKAK